MKIPWILKLSMLAAAIIMTLTQQTCYAGNKKIMTINAAKIAAERGLLESIHGLKVRATESVKDLLATSYAGTAETKTEGLLKGISYDEVLYDPVKDVAKVTASISLPSITNINGDVIDLKNKVFRRVGFATSTAASEGPLKALRVAEVDAYKQLAQRLAGFTLESQTKVENYILTSDSIKTKVLATLFLAEANEYGWTEEGDAYIKMSLNLTDFKEVVGQGIVGEGNVVTVEGLGAYKDDFESAKNKPAAQKGKKK